MFLKYLSNRYPRHKLGLLTMQGNYLYVFKYNLIVVLKYGEICLMTQRVIFGVLAAFYIKASCLNRLFERKIWRDCIRRLLKVRESNDYHTYKYILGSYPKIPQPYSKDLSDMVRSLLQVSPHQRPSTGKILNLPIVTRKIERYFPNG